MTVRTELKPTRIIKTSCKDADIRRRRLRRSQRNKSREQHQSRSQGHVNTPNPRHMISLLRKNVFRNLAGGYRSRMEVAHIASRIAEPQCIRRQLTLNPASSDNYFKNCEL